MYRADKHPVKGWAIVGPLGYLCSCISEAVAVETAMLLSEYRRSAQLKDR